MSGGGKLERFGAAQPRMPGSFAHFGDISG
jgi:hypothetical protein